jgi:hypothetical protein
MPDSEAPDPPESDPYCRHWSAIWDCEVKCARCGHECRKHDHDVSFVEGEGISCEECGCPAWVEPLEP